MSEFNKDLRIAMDFLKGYRKLTEPQIEKLKRNLQGLPRELRVNLPTPRTFPINELRKYDVVYPRLKTMMPHHVVVIKVARNVVFGINVTSTKSHLTGNKIKKNRMFKGNYYTNEIMRIPKDIAAKSYVFTLSDGRKEFQEHLDKVLEEYKIIL